MIPLEDPTTLSLLFHLNSEPWLNDQAYQVGTANQEFKRPGPVLAEIPLPVEKSALTNLFRERRSCRAFAPEAISLAQASALLAAAYGIVDVATFSDGARFLRRSVPSAGGLCPLEIYCFVQRVEALEDGMYHYDVLGHSLQLIERGNLYASLETIFYTYPFIRDANLVICLVAVFHRTQKKYGPRGYRYILLEAGHSGQNICLRAAELGLSTLCMGGFVDSRLNSKLGLKQTQEGVIYSVAAGHGL